MSIFCAYQAIIKTKFKIYYHNSFENGKQNIIPSANNNYFPFVDCLELSFALAATDRVHWNPQFIFRELRRPWLNNRLCTATVFNNKHTKDPSVTVTFINISAWKEYFLRSDALYNMLGVKFHLVNLFLWKYSNENRILQPENGIYAINKCTLQCFSGLFEVKLSLRC